MSDICCPFPSINSTKSTKFSNPLRRIARFLFDSARWVALATALLVTLGAADRATANIIFVTTTHQKISSTGGCSLQEAIYSANFADNVAIDSYPNFSDHFITTDCVPGTGNDTIVLPTSAVFHLATMNDAHNPFGPAATPIITSNITIEANGSTLVFAPGGVTSAYKYPRVFAVGTTGHLTLRSAYIKGFHVKGGDGASGGGGGMGAGGAIYVHAGGLVVENSTFEGNGAVGGNGSAFTCNTCPEEAGGGGGGLAGNGGLRSTAGGNGGGGGGARGNGFDGNFVPYSGGGGGGTLFDGRLDLGGFQCGGDGGDPKGTHLDGADASCSGGGGGGGAKDFSNSAGHGGKGAYGGGGGGGTFDSVSGNGGGGGDGGFGGGGGAGGPTQKGGNGGFGGGGGSGQDKPGAGGAFGGNPDSLYGGGGAGLGGAIFNDSGGVRILNSTFTGNFVYRGNSGGGSAGNGADAGGAIFSLNGHLTVVDSTISGNASTGSGAGIVMFLMGSPSLAPLFTLDNTIIANNGTGAPSATQCSIQGSGTIAASGAGNLIQHNDNCEGVVTSDDPLLGPLQFNFGGFTPTMAIPKTSPAWQTADPSTSLAADQRGQPRPGMGGKPDIGAFELCLDRFLMPCIISAGVGTPPDTEPLTIQASSVAGGTVNLPSGNYPLNSVVVLTATPKLGYSFINWTGAVADPNNPSTTVTMNQAQTVTANFIAQPTTMAGNLIAKSGPQNARLWTLSLLNNGPGVTSGPAINSFTLTQMSRAACTPVIGTAFPLAVSDLAPAQTGTANVTIDFTGCVASDHFTASFTYSATGGTVSGSVVRYNQYE
ncbi:MAG TPA: choice-of-anchor Q domain-containing protein [Candidatus Dormibacteraeota bacterium]|nr:choice-of-anchor Q domain-containing protein [Candidatus Dormibacteraeota bacterium]